MATREYCSNVAEELEVWSERLHKLSGKIDRVPSIDKFKMYPLIEELHIIMTELDDRLCEAMTECPTLEGPFKEDETGPKPGLKTNMNMNTYELFDYDFGG